jgi:hypothetical protein
MQELAQETTSSNLFEIKPNKYKTHSLISVCQECGQSFTATRRTKTFCSTKCRQTYHNRAASRGADFFHLFMTIRFDRAAAQEAGAWAFMCRMAAAYRAEDERRRDGRKSWDCVDAVKRRNARLEATTLSDNVLGRRRGG